MSVIASGSGGGGGGVTGLDTADGGTALADNKAVRGDGTTGIQGSLVDIDDSGNASLQDTADLRWSDLTVSWLTGPFLRVMNLAKDTYRSVNARAFQAHNGTTLKAALDPASRVGVAFASDCQISWDSDTTLGAGTVTATIRAGAGSPESVITAKIGSLYLRTDGGASTSLYVKESGTGNTGWVAK